MSATLADLERWMRAEHGILRLVVLTIDDGVLVGGEGDSGVRHGKGPDLESAVHEFLTGDQVAVEARLLKGQAARR